MNIKNERQKQLEIAIIENIIAYISENEKIKEKRPLAKGESP